MCIKEMYVYKTLRPKNGLLRNIVIEFVCNYS